MRGAMLVRHGAAFWRRPERLVQQKLFIRAFTFYSNKTTKPKTVVRFSGMHFHPEYAKIMHVNKYKKYKILSGLNIINFVSMAIGLNKSIRKWKAKWCRSNPGNMSAWLTNIYTSDSYIMNLYISVLCCIYKSHHLYIYIIFLCPSNIWMH